MRVGIVGTGSIAAKHALAYRNIGFTVVACTNRNVPRGLAFAAEHGAEFVATEEELCRHPKVDYVDLCTFPGYRLPIVKLCAEHRKHVLVQKPIATNLAAARTMIDVAAKANIRLGVVSQHRFDDSTLFLKQALDEGRLGEILQADAYVKWYRSQEYYRRRGKGTWEAEGGGALINQAIHQVDLLLHLVGPVSRVYGEWQLGRTHRIDSEDLLAATLRYANGATGVLQASTAMWSGYPERIEIHGTRGTAILTGDTITTWDIQNDVGMQPPKTREMCSGTSDPTAISVLPFERQFLDFAESCRHSREPLCSGIDGYRALEIVTSTYDSCRSGHAMTIPAWIKDASNSAALGTQAESSD